MKTEVKQQIYSDGNLVITKVKIEGGYVVNSYDKSHNMLGSCFVTDLRTQMAGIAMQGLISNYASTHESSHETCAETALKYADALIAELNKES